MLSIARLFTIILLLVLLTNASFALTPQQKIQYIAAASKAAKESVAKGEINRARIALLSVLVEVQSLAPAANRSPVKELFADYMVARNLAFKGAPAQAQLPAIQAFFQHFQKNKTRLLTFASELNMTTSLPNGKKAFRRHIANVLGQREAAWKELEKLAALSPPPDHLLANRQIFMQLFSAQVFMTFHKIVFGPALAAGVAQQRVIPELMDIAKRELAKATASKEPRSIWSALSEVKTSLDLVKCIEASLKGEMDISKLTIGSDAVARQMKVELKRANELFDKEVDNNRMPTNITWRGKGEKKILKEIKSAYKATFPSEEMLKIHLRSNDFHERWESWWRDTTLFSAYFGYVKVAVAAKQKSGDCRVFIKFFKRQRKSDGTWTPLQVDETVGSYLIRQENI